MAEYISKKDILQMIESTAMWNRSFSVLYEDIEDMKPANVSPVRHGQWIYNAESGECVCSACGENALAFRKDTLYGVDLYETCLTDYCPNCGADMRGSNDE